MKSTRSSMPIPLVLEGRGLGGERLGRRQHLPLEISVGLHFALLDGPDRLAGGAVEDVGETLLADLRERLDRPAVDLDVDESRRGREVVVPDPVVDRLEVPDPLPGLGVDGDDALGEEVVAEAMAAVVVAGRRAGRQIDVAELVVGAQRRPDVGVARVAPRLVQPGIGAEVVGLRDGAEHPPHVAGARVDPLDPAGRCLPADDEVRDDGRRDHHVAGDDRRRGHAHQVAALVVGGAPLRSRDVLHQIDPAVVAEVADGVAGAGVDRDEVRLARAPEDAGVLVAIAPVRQTARTVGVRRVASLVGLRIVHPERLAGAGIDRRRLVQRGGQVEHAVDHQRRRLQAADGDGPVVLPSGQRLEVDVAVDGLPAPGDAQILEVARVDLIQRGVLGAAVVAGVAAPLAVDGAVLRGGGLCRECQRSGSRDGDGNETCVSSGHETLQYGSGATDAGPLPAAGSGRRRRRTRLSYIARMEQATRLRFAAVVAARALLGGRVVYER